ncbi:DUF3486 family protein [Pseudanabaena sp. FACHB-1998]|uniref:phage protein Gp27 family protein n=1 Tax=Pseudanabaena sp. FACHB-1998 TaxID=2692858 RepID=UPI00167FF0D5|nr:phage protein Gp27 family protein [Pseudanabaena sp. FACHB-1998]MBD2179502.1 DUF3486 family protein [Pseudanabaena sp. FACHB-1998]
MIAARQIARISKLPRPVLRQLVKRFEQSHRKQLIIDDHVDWLAGKGYTISRSSVHRFIKQLRIIKASNPDGTDILALYLDEVERSGMCL